MNADTVKKPRKRTGPRCTGNGAFARRNVCLDEGTVARMQQLGDGNLSEGIRRAVAFLPTP